MAGFFLYVCSNSEQIVLYSLILRASAPVLCSKDENDRGLQKKVFALGLN
jgi:hypothetical protein